MTPNRTSIFVGLILVVALVAAAVGAFIADQSLDRYAESLEEAGFVTDVTRVKPSVVPTAIDETIAHVTATASPSSYPLIRATDRVHAQGTVVSAAVGHATALTSDGWFLVPQEVVQQHGTTLRLVQGTEVVSFDETVSDPATDVMFVKADVDQVRVSTFGSALRSATGAPVFVVSGERVYPRVLVDTWVTNGEAIQTSDAYTRTFLLDAPVDVASGALVTDANGAVIGLMDGSSTVIPLDHLIAGLDQVLASGTVDRPVLGVRVIDRSRVLLEEVVQQGLEITSVSRASAAQRAGLEVGDVIVRVQGQSVHDQTLDEWVLGASDGDTLLLAVVRDETEQEISVTL